LTEDIIKLNRSKIPSILFEFRKSRNRLLTRETKAPEKEIAYLYYFDQKIKK